MSNKDLRIYVLSGWIPMMSGGMAVLAERLKVYGETTYHAWNDPEVIRSINRQKGRVVVVGMSLGANQLGWFEMAKDGGYEHVTRRIELGIAYDPSRQSLLVRRNEKGEFVQYVTIYDRLVCYYNPGTWIYGGSKFVGPGVEIVEINMLHLATQSDEGLHQRTMQEIENLLRK